MNSRRFMCVALPQFVLISSSLPPRGILYINFSALSVFFRFLPSGIMFFLQSAFGHFNVRKYIRSPRLSPA